MTISNLITVELGSGSVPHYIKFLIKVDVEINATGHILRFTTPPLNTQSSLQFILSTKTLSKQL